MANRDALNSEVILCPEPQIVSRSFLHESLKSTGMVLLKDVDPASPEELIKWGGILGTVDVGITEELLGPDIMHLRYDADKAQKNELPAYFTSGFFPLHTDVSYVPNPPRYLLQHCVHADAEGGGISLLADCLQAKSKLSNAVLRTLRQPIFEFLYPPNCRHGKSKPFAICDKAMWRYKYSSMHFPAIAVDAVKLFNQALTEVTIPLELQRGDLLIIDNYRIAHGRTAYSHDHHGAPGRHIMRLYATDTGFTGHGVMGASAQT